MAIELKQANTLVFMGGVLSVNVGGRKDGWALLSVTDEGGEVELPASELRSLRDFLNRVCPND
jgi:hypothetical protein